MYTFMAGPRVTARHAKANVFGQVLFGRQTLGGSATLTTPNRPSMSESTSNAYFAMEPGGGVDFKVSDSVGIRLGVNVQLIDQTDARDWGRVPQIVVGFVWSAR